MAGRPPRGSDRSLGRVARAWAPVWGQNTPNWLKERPCGPELLFRPGAEAAMVGAVVEDVETAKEALVHRPEIMTPSAECPPQAIREQRLERPCSTLSREAILQIFYMHISLSPPMCQMHI